MKRTCIESYVPMKMLSRRRHHVIKSFLSQDRHQQAQFGHWSSKHQPEHRDIVRTFLSDLGLQTPWSLIFLFPAAWLQHSAVGRECQICMSKDATVVSKWDLQGNVKERKCVQWKFKQGMFVRRGQLPILESRLTSELPIFIHFW
jgi:hypothetical protein